ncbi:CAP-Gly domain-containing linker protein 1-like [Pezoporus flaviventris]|uniref:CAP-Gly domain-containing linker protein 1-like n=1 Tax=Pezoporus flaviventris TaxID=889875 RepID=UPI002AAF27BC|nr:CAP-Gly domain-containing linker protein 1-like [Pezoporus flaviventris]
MTALVTAACESSAAKIHQLPSALENIACKIELLTEKQALCERQNAELCKEQEYLQTQHKERVDLLNERMATKVNTNALLTETCDKTIVKEKEIISTKAALAGLKEKIAEKMSKLEKEKEEYDKENTEMKKFLESQEAKTSHRKHEFENLNVKSSDLQHKFKLCVLLDEEIALEKLREESKQVEKSLEFRKTDKLALLEQKIQLESELLLLQSKIAQEKEHFNKELVKIKEDLCNAKYLNKKLKLENEALRQNYEQVLEEQQLWTIERDEMGGIVFFIEEKSLDRWKILRRKRNA